MKSIALHTVYEKLHGSLMKSIWLTTATKWVCFMVLTVTILLKQTRELWLRLQRISLEKCSMLLFTVYPHLEHYMCKVNICENDRKLWKSISNSLWPCGDIYLASIGSDNGCLAHGQFQCWFIVIWNNEFWIQIYYRKISNIRRTKSPNLIVPHLVLQLSLPNPIKPGVRSRIRCSWSIADRWCSNYIWVIDNFIAY